MLAQERPDFTRRPEHNAFSDLQTDTSHRLFQEVDTTITQNRFMITSRDSQRDGVLSAAGILPGLILDNSNSNSQQPELHSVQPQFPESQTPGDGRPRRGTLRPWSRPQQEVPNLPGELHQVSPLGPQTPGASDRMDSHGNPEANEIPRLHGVR